MSEVKTKVVYEGRCIICDERIDGGLGTKIHSDYSNKLIIHPECIGELKHKLDYGADMVDLRNKNWEQVESTEGPFLKELLQTKMPSIPNYYNKVWKLLIELFPNGPTSKKVVVNGYLYGDGKIAMSSAGFGYQPSSHYRHQANYLSKIGANGPEAFKNLQQYKGMMAQHISNYSDRKEKFETFVDALEYLPSTDKYPITKERYSRSWKLDGFKVNHPIIDGTQYEWIEIDRRRTGPTIIYLKKKNSTISVDHELKLKDINPTNVQLIKDLYPVIKDKAKKWMESAGEIKEDFEQAIEKIEDELAQWLMMSRL